MNLFLANPWGLLALLGLPALAGVYFLQRRSRPQTVTTLFLIEEQRLESRAGRRFERWRNDAAFWLQALAIALLAWFLAQPRFLNDESFQRVVIVLDDSFSMAAYRQPLRDALEQRTAELASLAATTEWVLLPSHRDAPLLHAGADRGALLAAVEAWRPSRGDHGFDEALQLARARAGAEGRVLLLTDAEPEALPAGVDLLAVGNPLPNVGFTGATVTDTADGPRWQAILRNHASQPSRGTWRIERANAAPPRPFHLEPGEGVALAGAFPGEATELILTLEAEADALALDNRLCLVVPEPKPLIVAVEATGGGATRFLSRLAATIPNQQPLQADSEADLVALLATSYPAATASPGRIIFFSDASPDPTARLQRLPTAERHPLLDELNWSGLLAAPQKGFAPRQPDRVLLWFGDKPAIFLRTRPGGRDLVFNIDPRHSNLARLPACVLLVNRFAETIRRAKAVPERLNIPCGQRLPLVPPNPDHPLEWTAITGGDTRERTVPAGTAPALRAPAEPGFFTLSQDGQPVVSGAAQFADPREADLSDRAFASRSSTDNATVRAAHSRADPLAPLWLLLAGAALLGSWWRPQR